MITREKLVELDGREVKLYCQYNWKYDFLQFVTHDTPMDDTYVIVSDAVTVTVETLPIEAIIGDTVDALKEELVRHRADAERKAQAIQDQIDNLLALPAPVVVDDDGIPF